MQTTATQHNKLTVCIMSSVFQFLPVVNRFCIFWCIHQMISVAIAQSSSKYCRLFYMLGSLFPISCFYAALNMLKHRLRVYKLVIMLFSVVFCPEIKLLIQMSSKPLNPSDNIFSYDFHKILSYVDTTKR